MTWDIQAIKAAAKKDFEKTWVESTELLPKDTIVVLNKGKSHPFRDLVERLRQILIKEGFTEVENKYIIPEEDVYREYGPEAPIILDRCFYLATLPRPDIGLSKEKIDIITKIIGPFDEEKLKDILRRYKKGEIESDDFVEKLVKELKINTDQATAIVEKALPEFKKIQPLPTNLTLRSHMSGAWYHTLEALQNKSEFPLALFAIGPRFRNEQKEDASHLRVHHSASIVIMDPKMSLAAGKKIVRNILTKIGFEDVKFEVKKATSKYYAAGQEEEVFVKYKGKWLEIADIGMFSPISLANFNIKYPVFNMGVGVERIAMILNKVSDVRELVYPQFYEISKFTDEDIASAISLEKEVSSQKGLEIVNRIIEKAKEHADDPSPCEIDVFKGEVDGKQIEVKIKEPEENTKLLGPAALNEIYVKEGNILGIPPQASGKWAEKVKKLKQGAIYSNHSYIEAIAHEFVNQIMHTESGVIEKRWGMIRSPAELNIKIPENIRRFVTSQNKKIEIKGPVFTTLWAKITQ